MVMLQVKMVMEWRHGDDERAYYKRKQMGRGEQLKAHFLDGLLHPRGGRPLIPFS